MLNMLKSMLLLLVAGCTGNTVAVQQISSVVAISVTADAPTILIGAQSHLTSVVLDAAGAPLVNRVIVWTSSAPSVASVSAAGVVTGLAAGTALITAASEGVTGSATVAVMTPPPPTLARVAVTVDAPSIEVGGNAKATAIALDSAGNPLTGRAITWTCSKTSVALVTPAGVVTGVAAGTVDIVASSEGKNGVATMTVTTPPPAPGTVLFSDSFESGNLQQKQNGIGWTSNAYVDVSPATSRLGSRSARFRQGESVAGQGGHDAWSELRFGGLPNMREVFIQFYIYYPTGTESPNIGPRVRVTERRNDKFFRLWGSKDSDYGILPGNKVGASLFGDGSGSDATMGIEYMYSDRGGQWAEGEGPDTAPHPHAAFLNDSRRGRWIQMRIRVKAATAANNDGVVQIWADGAILLSRTNLQNANDPSIGSSYVGSTANTYTHGYLLGYFNNGAQPGQFTYIDDVVISSGGFAAP